MRYNDHSEDLMKNITIILIALLVWSGCVLGQGGSDISSETAIEMVRQPDTYLVDVRTIAEYVFVGHPEMAYNIPLTFWDERSIQNVANETFIEDIRVRFKPGDTLILICRSGGRSVMAMRMLRREGFQKLFNVQDGFEGRKDSKGLRTLDGWRNTGLPYTYQLDPDLLYSANR